MDQREYLKRLQRETQAIGRLHHPNIVSVHGLGLVGDGRPYISMELLEGELLKEYLERHKKLTARDPLRACPGSIELRTRCGHHSPRPQT